MNAPSKWTVWLALAALGLGTAGCEARKRLITEGVDPSTETLPDTSAPSDGPAIEEQLAKEGTVAFDRIATDEGGGIPVTTRCHVAQVGETVFGTCRPTEGEGTACLFESASATFDSENFECKPVEALTPSGPSTETEDTTLTVTDNTLVSDLNADGVAETIPVGTGFTVTDPDGNATTCVTALVEDVLLIQCDTGTLSCITRFNQLPGTSTYQASATNCPVAEAPPETALEVNPAESTDDTCTSDSDCTGGDASVVIE